MSKDIRSFFAPKGASLPSNGKKAENPKVKKRVYNVIDSDEDDAFVEKPQVKKVKEEKQKPKVSPKKKEPEKAAPKPVDISNFFGKSPVQQKPQTLIKPSTPKHDLPVSTPTSEGKRNRSKKRKKQVEAGGELVLEEHFDDDFEATLLLLDDEQLGITPQKTNGQESDTEQVTTPAAKRKIKELFEVDAKVEKYKTPDKKAVEESKRSSSNKKEKESKRKNSKEEQKKTPEKKVSAEESKLSSSKKEKETIRKNIEIERKKTPEKKEKTEVEPVASSSKIPKDGCGCVSEDAPCDCDIKRKTSAQAYHRYLNRGGPKNPGSKPIPEVTPNCLRGKSFVITGVLESLEREEAAELIKNCGGRTTTSVSKKTNYVVLGEEPGASKMRNAETFKTPLLSEDALLDMIRSFSVNGKNTSPKKSQVDEESKYFPANKKEEAAVHSAKKLKFDEVDKIKVPVNNFYAKKPLPKSSDSGIQSLGSDSESSHKSVLSESSTRIRDLGDTLWVDKYKPKSTKTIIGQNGDRSNVKKLTKWLNDWHKHHGHVEKKKAARPAPWAQGDDGSYYKAALLSGPPGVGKTTSVHLVCKELGFDVVEFNASDTRSKRLLGEQVAELLASKSIRNFYSVGNGSVEKKHVLVMDEVDGMAGNEDRGGVQELIQLIKGSRTPIVCMCNDRSLPKMRSLVNYCFDLRFNRPRVEQIKGAMMSICFKEGIKIDGDALANIITSANQDVRQVLHNLSLWGVKDKGITGEQAKIDAAKAKKSLKMGPWDVARQVFSQSDQEKTTLREKEDLFFQDYNLGPLFVQDVYSHVKPFKARGDKKKVLECLSRAADSLAWGDVVEKKIRSQNAWGLLPVQAIFSSVVPGHEMSGHVMGQITFPAWLGKNSKRNRIDRLLQELHVHTRLSTSGSKQAVNLDYAQPLRDSILRPLIADGSEGVPSSLDVMRKYQLLREDLDSLVELCQWPNRNDPFTSIDSKVKAAFTRAYNKESLATPYAASGAFKKVKSDEGELLESAMQDGESETIIDDEDPDDITADSMIKKGKPKKPPAAKKEEAGSSKMKRGKAPGKAKKV